MIRGVRCVNGMRSKSMFVQADGRDRIKAPLIWQKNGRQKYFFPDRIECRSPLSKTLRDRLKSRPFQQEQTEGTELRGIVLGFRVFSFFVSFCSRVPPTVISCLPSFCQQSSRRPAIVGCRVEGLAKKCEAEIFFSQG